MWNLLCANTNIYPENISGQNESPLARSKNANIIVTLHSFYFWCLMIYKPHHQRSLGLVKWDSLTWTNFYPKRFSRAYYYLYYIEIAQSTCHCWNKFSKDSKYSVTAATGKNLPGEEDPGRSKLPSSEKCNRLLISVICFFPGYIIQIHHEQ